MTQVNLKVNQRLETYQNFQKINGVHDLQKKVPEACVMYQARKRKGGKVAFFNFDLAKNMGLISKDHPEVMTKELETAFLETFSLIIINEYDIQNNKKFPKEDILPNKYMATRYLQLQHPNKKGETSGDGRSVWNGQYTYNGMSWDISSCGTGATCLSPATHLNKKFFESGDPSISYGCGYSEIDEGIATLFMSEVFYQNHIETERVLGIIEFDKGISINIRAHHNLIRPSHMFAPLKQENWAYLKSMVDYYIARQMANKDYPNFLKTDDDKYDYFLNRVTEDFAKIAARFEDDYIFCWLDWDGDNVLMNGGIIDYGSVRQFGLFHHEYRYDDVQRFSTNLLEQKYKARYTVQVFSQLVDYLKTKKKKNLKSFAQTGACKKFDQYFKVYKDRNLCFKLGFDHAQTDDILKNDLALLKKFRRPYEYFERCTSSKGEQKIPDGIITNSIFCMRDILRELPQIYLNRTSFLTPDEFFDIIRSSYATKKDLKIGSHQLKMIDEFQKNYAKLVEKMAKRFKTGSEDILLQMNMRSSVINKYDRVTGDASIKIVDKILKARPKYSGVDIFKIVTSFRNIQNSDPTFYLNKADEQSLSENQVVQKTMRSILKIVRENREGI